MRKLLALAIVVVCVCGLTLSVNAAERPFAPVQDGYVASPPMVQEWAPDRVMVQFTREAMNQANIADPANKSVDPRALTGIADLDQTLMAVDALSLRVAFPRVADKARASSLGTDRWYILDLGKGSDVPAVASRLLQNKNLADALPDYAVFPTAVPNDPYYPQIWGHNNTVQLPGGAFHNGSPVGTLGFDSNAQPAWDGAQGYGNPGIVIAILDSGVDPTHPDLNQVTGYDFGDNDSNPADDSGQAGHGTACAGIAAGIANNALGVTGIAGGCSIMPLKIANSAGSMYLSASTNALYYAADNGADIASMSFSSSITVNAPMDNAISYAYSAGVTMLGSTGNDNATQIGYPAYSALVIGVGAASPCGDRKRSSSSAGQVSGSVNTDPNGTTCDGEYWWGSSYGPAIQNHKGAVDVIAPTILPTTDIQGTAGYSFNNYSSYFNGTSCACPYAAGVAALIKAANPTFNANEVRTQLVGTAQDIVNVESVVGWDRYAGYGMVDAAAAVGAVIPPPVVAEFSADATFACGLLTVNFTDETVGTVDSWNWDFGDGLASIQQNPSHTYSNPGIYDVTLSASGPDGGDTMIKAGYIVVGAVPVASFTGTPAFPTPINFGDTVVFTDTSTGDPASWAWDFGDGGTSTDQNPSHAYFASGFFAVSLTVTTGCGADTETITNMVFVLPGAGPTADFSYDPATGCAPLEVAFTDLSTGTPTSWAWDFGDGGTSTAASPSHIYTVAGTYTVTLTVTNSGGSDAKTVTDAITVGGAPTAAFAVSDTVGAGPLEVTFTDSSTDATAWAWDFGDGGSSSVQNPVHTFADKGTYDVRLIASNSCGADTLLVVEAVRVAYVSGVGDQTPVAFGLGRNFPNPFNPSTTIVFNLEKPGRARVEVFDISGRLVDTLIDADKAAGRHEIEWRPGDLASGVYFARLVSERQVDTRRVTLLK